MQSNEYKGAPEPRKGMRFWHSRWLDTQKWDGKSPQLFQVTKIARGTVYYRPVYDYGEREGLGKAMCCDVAQFPKYCAAPADLIASCAVQAAAKIA